MFPPVYQTLRANATVLATVADRIGRHGEIEQDATRPYITWQIVSGNPYDVLSSAPCADFTTVQIDIYSPTDAGAAALAVAVRDALDTALVVNRVVVNLREPDTRLYRVGMEADFITQR